jgi:CubicO group peptidase (beta-lactamase class C family)
VAVIEGDSVSYHTYSKNGEESEIYDYEIGSVSKTFVGLMIAKGESEGKLKLTDSISKYLDLSGEQYYPTIERLLTHTAGYAEYYFEGSMIGNLFAHVDNDFYGISREKLLEKVKTTILEDKDYPFVYSNFGISVLGLVLEKIYGQDFHHLMNDFILNELKLPNTAVAKQDGSLSGYWQWNQTDGYLPAGAIHSNIVDMASYLQCYLGGALSYIAKTYQPIKQVNANNASYELLNIRLDSVGMTWILDEKNNVVWHNGATTNFNSYVTSALPRIEQRALLCLVI